MASDVSLLSYLGTVQVQLIDKQAVFEAIAGFCKGLTIDKNKRLSVDPAPINADYSFTKDTIGKTFSFQGRRQESADIYAFIYKQDEVRSNAHASIVLDPVNKSTNWDTYKRFDIPVSMGIAGIGKSELTRKGVSEHIKTLNQDYFDAASPREQQFLTIMRDENKCCNIRLGERSCWIIRIM
jgi:hypothetical protein